MYKKLFVEDIGVFFKSLNSLGIVQGPAILGGSSHEFKQDCSLNELDLTYTRTMIPPKKFLLKAEEVIFEFDEEKAELREPSEEERMVIFGIHPCDIHALQLLDRIYINEIPDKYYIKRREITFLIGVSCHPDEHCFCKSTGTSYATGGFDLFLHELSDGYFVRIGSEKGYEILRANSSIYKDVEARDIEEFKLSERKRLDEFKLELNVIGLQNILDLAYSNPVWKETADKCFGCGVCNLVCPTCRCYDVNDYMNLDLKTGERVRIWDSCMLRKHGLVAGGLNFRPTRVERLINRFNCKGSLREGLFNCVGCGRCTVYCPADIDFVEIMKKVRSEL